MQPINYTCTKSNEENLFQQIRLCTFGKFVCQCARTAVDSQQTHHGQHSNYCPDDLITLGPVGKLTNHKWFDIVTVLIHYKLEIENGLFKLISPVFIIFEKVEACTGRTEQNNIPFL